MDGNLSETRYLTEAESKLHRYREIVDARKEQYRWDFTALEASWVAARQGAIDRVEATRIVSISSGGLDGLIDFLSAPIDARFELKRDKMQVAYQRDVANIRAECGL